MKKSICVTALAMCALLMFTGCPNAAGNDDESEDTKQTNSSTFSLYLQYPPQEDGYPSDDNGDADSDGLKKSTFVQSKNTLNLSSCTSNC